MTAKTPISIVQTAMLHIGCNPITDLDEESDAADTVNRLYPDQRDLFLTLHPWSFADKRAQLTRLPDAPANEWEYQFTLPTDRVALPRTLFLSPDPGAPPFKDFEYGDGVVFTNADALWGVYTYNCPEGRWPPYFVAFVEHALAAVFGVALKVPDADVAREDRIAWGMPSEGRKGGLFATARFADGRFQPTRSLLGGGGPLLQARQGGC